MANTKALALILVAVIVSFLGFCIENIFISFFRGFVDNRNMVLPFLFGYGLSIIAYFYLFGTPNAPLFFGKIISFDSTLKSTLYSFTVAFLGVCIGEIILGYLIEWCCDIIWWDYSIIPLHITRYTSVPTSVGFAFLITIFMKYCFDPLTMFFSRMNPFVLSSLSILLVVVLSLDMLNSGIYMFRNHDTLHLWRYNLQIPLKDMLSNKLSDFKVYLRIMVYDRSVK